MSTAQRVSRGFHWLAIFSAAIALLIGITVSIIIARDHTNTLRQYHGELLCAHARAESARKKSAEQQGLTDEELYAVGPPAANFGSPSDEIYDLKQIGCSEESSKVSWNQIVEASWPGEFNYLVEFLPPLFLGVAISLAA